MNGPSGPRWQMLDSIAKNTPHRLPRKGIRRGQRDSKLMRRHRSIPPRACLTTKGEEAGISRSPLLLAGRH